MTSHPHSDGSLLDPQYWEAAYFKPPRMRLPSKLAVGTRDLLRLLKKYVRPGMDVCEIGFAPGKHLAYVAKVLKANVSGIDFSRQGVEYARQLFDSLGIRGDLRCEDIFQTTFPSHNFDLVYSSGVIEHFYDPREIVRQHVRLLKPGGQALIIIPNYQSIYGRIQNLLDPDNLKIHNLSIMNENMLGQLAPPELARQVRTFRIGCLNPWLLNFEKKLPNIMAKAIQLSLNGIGWMQPFKISPICPWLVMEITRKTQ